MSEFIEAASELVGQAFQPDQFRENVRPESLTYKVRGPRFTAAAPE